MSTVTVRELHRSTGAILERVAREGAVIVRRRDGRRFRIEAEKSAPAKKKPQWPDFAARRARIGPPIHPDICAAVDKAIRGE
jgi:hypothetical protein